MAMNLIEDDGFYSLSVDTESQKVFVEDQDDNLIILKKGSKFFKDTSTTWKLSAAEEFENSIAIIKENYDDLKKEIIAYKFSFSGKYKNEKKYNVNSYEYYELESIAGKNYNNDSVIGLAFDLINDFGDEILYKDYFDNIAVIENINEEDDYEHITYKKKKIESTTKGWTAISALSVNGENIVIQKQEGSSDIKKLYNSGGNWNLTKTKKIKDSMDIYYELELETGEDFNNDGSVGYKNTAIEQDGNNNTYINEKGELFVDSIDGYKNLIYKGIKVNVNQFKAQGILGCDTDDDDNNFVVWEHSSGNLIKWDMNEEWEFISSSLAIYQSYEYYLLESFLNQDADEDGKNGLQAINYLDNYGLINLSIDSVNNIYYYQANQEESIDDLSTIDFNPIYHKGQQLNSSGIDDYAILGIENISSENYLVLESNNGDLKQYFVNETGSLESYTKIKYQTADYFSAEENFNQDFDGDGIPGFSFDDPFDTFGNTELLTDQVDNIYAKSESILPIKYQNAQVKEAQFTGLTMLGAETDLKTNVNYIAWEENSTNKLSVWSLDSNWNFKSYENIELNSDDYYENEKFFLQDFNGDTVVGYSYTNIETNGLTTLKADNQLGVAYADSIILEMDSANFFGGVSVQNTSNAITYNGAKVKEDSFTEQFGLYLLGAEISENQQLVAWADGSKNLTIWQTDEEWKYSNSFEIEYNSADFLEYETIFNQDWNNDKVVGSQETIIESDKFVATQTDQFGNVFLSIANIEYVLKNNDVQVNINDIWWDTSLDENQNGSYQILASETNLWQNKVYNQVAWGFFDDETDALTKIAIWSMNDEWTSVESIDVVQKTNQEVELNIEYQLLEFSFATDLDGLEGIGNNFSGFYAFSQGNTVEEKGNTILKKSLDQSTYYVEQNANIIASNSDNSLVVTIDETSDKLVDYLTENNLTIVGAEKINGQNTLVLTNELDDMVLLTFNSSSWDLTSEDIENNQKIVSQGTKKFNYFESIILQDIDGDEVTGSLEIPNKYFTIEDNGELDLIYTDDSQYIVVDSAGNSTEFNSLSNSFEIEYSLIGVESIDSVNKLLITYEDMQYAIYESNELWTTFEQVSTYDFSNLSSDKDKLEELENLENLFDVDINLNNIIGSSLDIETQGTISLSLTSDNKITLTNESEAIVQYKNKDLDLNKGKFKKFEILASESISNKNSILVKYNKGKNKSTHYVWDLDEENSLSKIFKNKIKANNLYEYEKIFQYDINSDDSIGSNFMPLEIGGDIKLKKDSQGNIGIYNEESNSSNYLSNKKGVLLNESLSKHYTVAGADVVQGVNSLVAVHNKSSNLKVMTFNIDWTKQKKVKKYKTSQLIYFDIETALEQDLNNDSIIGIGYSAVETNGIILKEDTLGSAFVEDGESLIGISNKKGKSLKVNNKIWNIFAATEYDDVNYIAYKNNTGSKFKVMKMNDDWSIDKLFDKFSGNDSSEIELVETMFGQSFVS